MPFMHEAVAIINGKPAGSVGVYLRKADYVPYRCSPPVRWKRITVSQDLYAKVRSWSEEKSSGVRS